MFCCCAVEQKSLLSVYVCVDRCVTKRYESLVLLRGNIFRANFIFFSLEVSLSKYLFHQILKRIIECYYVYVLTFQVSILLWNKHMNMILFPNCLFFIALKFQRIWTIFDVIIKNFISSFDWMFEFNPFLYTKHFESFKICFVIFYLNSAQTV